MIRKRIQVRGIVQGVGFRPFVYNLAVGLGLRGYVLNSTRGVTVEVEGDAADIERFLDDFRGHPPPLAQIDDLEISTLEPNGDADFVIRESTEDAEEFALVPPDIATCEPCLADFSDPANRRYRYPFTNCTNCGPRYTIIQDIPYDRPFTTMSEFRMCPDCQAEYENPADRRFHAQPNACPACGPSLELWNRERPVARRHEALAEVRRLLKEGAIIAIKGLGGFHLACDAENEAAVRLLRERKRRSDKPFALMARDLASVGRICALSDTGRRTLAGPRRPIVILPRLPGSSISPAVAPGNRTLGVMLPYTPLHHLLFGDSPGAEPAFTALVMTSGNISEEPIVSRNEEVRGRLHELCDYFLLHNRRIQTRVDDSVVRMFEEKVRVLRRSRGYAPHPINLGRPLEQILAVGGELKNTFCLAKNRYAILSQHVGDLENYETLVFFEETLEHMKRFFRVEPRAVAYDLHPGYLSTRLALAMAGVEKIGVQHHHAHIAACMAENRLREKVIGVAMDGTGYGVDGRIWGGEFLVSDLAGFERRAHLRYVPLPGGDTAIRQPWRLALSYLRDTFGAQARSFDLPPLREVPERALQVVDSMITRGVNTVDTSSCGRLFDAVASLVGLRQEINFEGQAAIELEAAAEGAGAEYPFEIDGSTDPWQIDMRPAIESIVRDILAGTPAGVISANFHRTMAAVIVRVCRHLRNRDRLAKVCLSGGTFQNWRLLEAAVRGLRGSGFEVYLHAQVPPNDGGISLGQAVIANEILGGR